MPRKAKIYALDRLLPGRFGSQADQSLALNIMGLNIPALSPCIFMSKKGPGSERFWQLSRGVRSELRMFGAREDRRRRKKPDELAWEPSRECAPAKEGAH